MKTFEKYLKAFDDDICIDFFVEKSTIKLTHMPTGLDFEKVGSFDFENVYCSKQNLMEKLKEHCKEEEKRREEKRKAKHKAAEEKRLKAEAVVIS